jgi:signal transduction histidine kinase
MSDSVPCVRPTVEELARFPLFADDTPDALQWLADHFEVRCFEAGDVIIQEGDPTKDFFVVLEGAIQFRMTGDTSVFTREAGEPGGMLPFSRMKVARGRAIVVRRTRLVAMPATDLRELVYRAPNLAQKLVSEMTDRTRETTRIAERTEKMLALGKLSAGLAHELNNPASAVVRSAAMLRETLALRRRYGILLRGEAIPPQAQAIIATLTESINDCLNVNHKDALERADLAADLADWLDEQGAPSELAGDLVDADLTREKLAPLTTLISKEAFNSGLRILTSDYQVLCLTGEIEDASRRISDLIQAVKSYSYMDQTPLSEVDVEPGIDVTLRMFQHQLKHGIQVERKFDGHLPKIPANGSELNQVWTNLIDNAIAAMAKLPEGEKVLEVHTALEPDFVLVEIADNGPGVPPEIQGRIFDPFFTTKPVGEGTGLGLDIVQRIIRSHHGLIRLESKPGRTAFQVRLPRVRPPAEGLAL